MTRPKKLAPEYEAEVEHALFDLTSLVSAAHLIPRATYMASLRFVLRRAIDRSAAKAVIEASKTLDITVTKVDNSHA